MRKKNEGLTPEQIEELLNDWRSTIPEIEGKCAICRKIPKSCQNSYESCLGHETKENTCQLSSMPQTYP